uniref:Putative conserved secreted protein n=1 Tax=Rhipicephalus microplus TaxID=6941 RepID=A0A6G5A347_RHIMP
MKVTIMILLLVAQHAFSEDKFFTSTGSQCIIHGTAVSVGGRHFFKDLCIVVTCGNGWGGYGNIYGCPPHGQEPAKWELRECCKATKS